MVACAAHEGSRSAAHSAIADLQVPALMPWVSHVSSLNLPPAASITCPLLSSIACRMQLHEQPSVHATTGLQVPGLIPWVVVPPRALGISRPLLHYRMPRAVP
jgi:hypothetical protein